MVKSNTRYFLARVIMDDYVLLGGQFCACYSRTATGNQTEQVTPGNPPAWLISGKVNCAD